MAKGVRLGLKTSWLQTIQWQPRPVRTVKTPPDISTEFRHRDRRNYLSRTFLLSGLNSLCPQQNSCWSLIPWSNSAKVGNLQEMFRAEVIKHRDQRQCEFSQDGISPWRTGSAPAPRVVTQWFGLSWLSSFCPPKGSPKVVLFISDQKALIRDGQLHCEIRAGTVSKTTLFSL